jgi:transcription elongation GreA/GreB family factor
MTRTESALHDLASAAPETASSPVTGDIALTSDGRALLADRLRTLREVTLPELRPILTDRERDERDVADFERLTAEAEELDYVLATALTLPPATGAEVVLGSRVLVRMPGRKRATVRPVHAVEASLDDERISVDSPLSQALLGAVAGDSVTVDGPTGSWRCHVLEVLPDITVPGDGDGDVATP